MHFTHHVNKSYAFENQNILIIEQQLDFNLNDTPLYISEIKSGPFSTQISVNCGDCCNL